MKNPIELTAEQSMNIDGGSPPRTGPTLFVEVAHAIFDYSKGFIDEFLKYSTNT